MRAVVCTYQSSLWNTFKLRVSNAVEIGERHFSFKHIKIVFLLWMDICHQVGIFIILNKVYHHLELIFSVEYYFELDNEEAYWFFDTI